MTEYEKEMQLDMVMLSDSWTVKLRAAGFLGLTKNPKREEQMLTRMDRNFGDAV